MYKPEYRQAICSQVWFPDNENMPNIFCLLKLRDSHLNVLKVCLRYISFRAWGQGERASNSCGQTLDIYHASWPDTETGSILVTGRIVSPICVILSTDDLPASSCLQSPLQTCKPCLTIMMYNIRRRLCQCHTFTNLWMSVISTLIEMLVHKVLRRLCAWWSLGYLLHQTPVSGGFANKPPKFNVETTRPNTNFLLQMMIVIHRLHVCSTPPSLNYTFIQRPLASLDILPLVTILPHWTQRWLGC